jgi:hypothetical protein
MSFEQNNTVSELITSYDRELKHFSSSVNNSDSEIYEDFIKLLADYSSKNKTDVYNYFGELRLEKAKSYYPYLFNMIPNRLLLKSTVWLTTIRIPH